MALFKFLFSGLILIVGAVGIIVYVVRPWVQRRSLMRTIHSPRPWRPLGAAMGCVIAVMFVLGIYVVDIPDHPRVYAAYWAVMLLLQFWLCMLAIKDVRYTRHYLSSKASLNRWSGSVVSDSINVKR